MSPYLNLAVFGKSLGGPTKGQTDIISNQRDVVSNILKHRDWKILGKGRFVYLVVEVLLILVVGDGLGVNVTVPDKLASLGGHLL